MKNVLKIVVLFFTFSVQGQISVSWNLNIDNYTNSSSNYARKYVPIEIAQFSNSERVVLSQNGTLIKFNSSGTIIWSKKTSVCAKQRIIIDSKDNIIIICGSKITKLDYNGEEIWKKDYSTVFNKKYLTFDALAFFKDKFYIVGHFFHSKYICQLSIDLNGRVLWKTKFKQDVDYDYSFIEPKQIVLNNERIYILAHDYSNSFLYFSNLDGKKRKEIKMDYKIKKMKLRNDSLFALGHLNNLKDKLVFTKLDTDLNVLEKSEFELNRNIDYKKAIRNWATVPPTKEEFDKNHITAYDINDFEFLNAQNLLVVGSSDGKQWIGNVDLKKDIVWNWDKEDSRYFKFNNEYSQHNFSLYSVDRIDNKYLISGISEEEDYKESGFIKYINIFVREIKLD
jgi:outer membrane protein assembly factor BamB